jgi:hypothetical protein
MYGFSAFAKTHKKCIFRVEAASVRLRCGVSVRRMPLNTEDCPHGCIRTSINTRFEDVMAAQENGHLKQILGGMLLLGMFGVAVFFLYPGTHSNGGVVLEKDAEDIAAQGRRIIAAMDLDPAGFRGRATLTPDNPVLERIYDRYDTPEANALLRGGVPGYTWKLRLLREDHEEIRPEKGKNGFEEDMVRRMLTGDLLLVFDGHGRLLRLEIQTDDSLAAPALSDADAYAAVRRLLLPVIPPSRIGALATLQAFDDSLAATAGLRLARSVLPRRVDHEIRWSVYDAALADTVDMRAVLAGELLTRFECVPRFTRDYSATDTTGIADIFEAAVYVIFGIVLIVVLIRRLRNYEMGFRNAVFMGIGIALLFGVWMYYELGGQMRSAPELLIPLLIAPLFVGAGFVPLWAVAFPGGTGRAARDRGGLRHAGDRPGHGPPARRHRYLLAAPRRW